MQEKECTVQKHKMGYRCGQCDRLRIQKEYCTCKYPNFFKGRCYQCSKPEQGTVEEPKPECDHLLFDRDDGDYYNSTMMVSLSDLKLGELLNNSSDDVWASILRDSALLVATDQDKDSTKFYFCPKKGCGSPIDWEAIEKKLNTTK